MLNIKPFSKILAILAAIVVSGCTTVSTLYTDFDPRANFPAYDSFSWASDDPVLHLGNYEITSKTDRNVADAIRTTLTNKGYRFVSERENADLLVSISLGALDKEDIVENAVPEMLYNTDWRWAYRYGPQYSVQNFTSGTLAVDFIDTDTQHPIWHGRGTKRLSRAELNLDDDRESIADAIQQILASFPEK